jgi:secondary thiamine-phosphate synthase enzyme
MRVETLHEGAVARNATGRLVIPTRGPGFTEITDLVAPWVAELRMRDGLLVAFCRHTSASLTIQENADPDVRRDLLAALDRLAPRDAPYVHDMEGPDDMPAHIRTMITDSGRAHPRRAGPEPRAFRTLRKMSSGPPTVIPGRRRRARNP